MEVEEGEGGDVDEGEGGEDAVFVLGGGLVREEWWLWDGFEGWEDILGEMVRSRWLRE